MPHIVDIRPIKTQWNGIEKWVAVATALSHTGGIGGGSGDDGRRRKGCMAVPAPVRDFELCVFEERLALSCDGEHVDLDV